MAKRPGFRTAVLMAAAAGAALGWEGRARADGGPAVTWVESEAGAYWQAQAAPDFSTPGSGAPATISVSTGPMLQRIDGFGGAVSELGWQAIQKASPADQTNVINSLFGANGCNLNMARVPIGSSDFALGYYSDDDSPGDYNLKHFSIGRDQQNLIPFLKAAQQAHSNLQVWGVPWTPPAWMKTSNIYYGGSLTNTPQIMTTYANYLADWAQAYEGQGINVMAVAPQNEPGVSQTYPSCIWTASQLDTFIGSYLGPALQAKGLNTGVWLGTLDGFNGGSTSIPNVVLADSTARSYITGAAFQYSAEGSIPGVHQLDPGIELVQSESIVTDASNPWSDGQALFGEMKSYFDAGANEYFNWNMVLNETGQSNWGWAQDCMVTVNQTSGQVTYNPDYYVMRHFSQFVQAGAHEVSSTSSGGVQDIAFVNPDGSTVVVAYNGSSFGEVTAIDVGNQELDVTLDAGSVSTFVIAAPEPGTVGVVLVAAGGLLLRRRAGRRF